MPLCTYFMNGSCRFGSKCVNDHIDLKTLLKNEVDSILNGKQWLLSCFGPFKESAVLPNFINDQSFEEIRLGFLENSKNGNIQGYISNLMNEYNTAVQKMNELKMASNDTLQVVASIYNTSNNDQKSNNVSQKTQPQTQNPFQSSNIFGSFSQSQVIPQSTTSIFNPQNPQQTQTQMMSAASIFGGTSSSNPFQSSQQQQANTGNTVQQSPFSYSISQTNQPKPSSSIFGQSTTSNTSSIFGNQPSIFGGGQTANSAFSMPASSQNSQPSNIFGSFSQSQVIPQTTTSIFSSQAMPTSQPNIFQQQQTTNIFQTPFQSQPAVQEMQPIQSNNIFNINQPVQQQQQQTTSAFAMQSSISTQPQPSVFGGNPFQTAATIIDDHFYSKAEDLTPEYLQEYQAESFTLGKIPLVPPTKNLALG